MGISCGLVAVRWIPPGDCRAALRLAMTAVVGGWCFCFSWAIVKAGRRGHDPALRIEHGDIKRERHIGRSLHLILEQADLAGIRQVAEGARVLEHLDVGF